MDKRSEMLDSLIEAYDLMTSGMPPDELDESGLMDAWVDQVTAALAASGMELERQIWAYAKTLRIASTGRVGFKVYSAGMRAILLGMLHNAQQQ